MPALVSADPLGEGSIARPRRSGTPTRPSVRHIIALVTLGLALALLVVYGALWLGLPGAFQTGNDFAPTYVAGGLALQGNGAAMYDQNTVYAMERANAPRGYRVHLPFISPPPRL